VVHCESVLRAFYDIHLEVGSGPVVNPFPLVRGRRGRANAHHNPMDPFVGERTGRYRPKLVERVPRQIPDERFNELFVRLGCDRDRALVAFWVSTRARAAELLGARPTRGRLSLHRRRSRPGGAAIALGHPGVPLLRDGGSATPVPAIRALPELAALVT
jgi:hypothetical protein